MAAAPPRTSRKEAKERTRQRLLDAIVRLLHDEGPTALTTARIAEQAGIAQPTFYVHFPDLEAALDETAERLGDALLGRMQERAPAPEEADPRDAIRAAFRALVDAMLADRRLAEIFLRHRRDQSSPFGKRFRRVLAQTRERIEAQLEARGVPDPGVHAALITGAAIGAVEALLDRRIADRDAAVEALVHHTTMALAPLVGRART